MTIDEVKRPLLPWKKLQETKWTDEQLSQHLQSPKVWRFGLVTGFNDLFCIDVDLKVFSNINDREPFWDEFISFIRDNIDEFDKKIAVYKTQNFGYHLVYRTRTTMGNKKLATRKGHKEAVIETRGVGGYIVAYDASINETDYVSCQLISEHEHETIVGICRYFDEPDNPQKEIIKPRANDGNYEKGVTPWDDYNNRHTVFDVIGDQFEIVRNISSRYIVKRHNATSAHSGYVYKDSGCVYLFTTGTEYPNEKLLSPFACYAWRNHHGDYSQAASTLYHDGYGDRVARKIDRIEQEIPIDVETLNFPIDIFPKGVQHYILECNRTLDSSVDYMGVGMLWLLSVIIGNSLRIKVKNGWTEGSVVWISVVGKAGLGKTPSIDHAIKPLVAINNREIKQYKKQYSKWKEYEALEPKVKKNVEEVREPPKKQFIANDITLEALFELHEENQNAVGVFKDELAGWIKDMNKYRAGSDVEAWLQSWSNKPISLNRKSVANIHVESPSISVLGGIQPNILSELFTPEQKDNGFVDRMLLTFPDLEISPYNENELDEGLLQWYFDFISQFHSAVKNEVIQVDEDMSIVPHVIDLSPEARVEWKRIFNEITTIQNSDEENEYMKSMLPKQKAYIPRFALLLGTLERFQKGEPVNELISREAMLKAEKLSKYFISMARKLKVETMAVNDLKSIVEDKKRSPKLEQYKVMRDANPNLNRSTVADLLEVSRMTINRWDKKLDGETPKK